MAKGQTQSKNVIINNRPTVTVVKIVELIVKNDQLVADTNDTESGVNSRTQ